MTNATSANRRLWLIDAGYLLNAQRSVSERYHFDYAKLRKKIEGDGPLWRACFFNSIHDAPSDKVSSFNYWLERDPRGPKIEVKLYRLKRSHLPQGHCSHCDSQVNPSCPGCRGPLFYHMQKGVDVGMATMALTLAAEYGTLILSSGDADLVDAVKHLANTGHRIELVVFDHGVSTELERYADRVAYINDFAEEVRR